MTLFYFRRIPRLPAYGGAGRGSSQFAHMSPARRTAYLIPMLRQCNPAYDDHASPLLLAAENASLAERGADLARRYGGARWSNRSKSPHWHAASEGL